jgi:hypothetical protein
MSPTLSAQLFRYFCKGFPLKDLSCSPVLIHGKAFRRIHQKPENHLIFSMYNTILNENPVDWALEIQTSDHNGIFDIRQLGLAI